MGEKEIFNRQGFLLLEGFFGKEKISELHETIDPIFIQWRNGAYKNIIEQELINMHSLTHIDYFNHNKEDRIRFFTALLPPSLTTLIDRMFGEGLYFHNTQLFFNPINNRKMPYWHRDLQYSSIEDAEQAREKDSLLTLHIRIPLVEEVGVELISGTHRRWDTVLERDVRFQINGHVQTEDLPHSTLISMKPGDILIFSGQMIHRGCYHRNSSRMALDLCVGKYHPFTVSFLDPRTLPSDEEMEQISNNAWYKRAKALTGHGGSQ